VFAPVESLGPHAMVFAVFMITSVFAQLITNKGAAVLMFPIVMAIAHDSGMNPEPLVLTLMASAACSFMTPVGFVTNLMVLGPGGYRFTDYVRLGLPLTLMIALIASVVAPLVFPAHPLD
jgi:di/tricarboxylate transporter